MKAKPNLPPPPPVQKIRHKLYTDGSCLGNPGPGGYSAILLKDNDLSNATAGKKLKTTSIEMELLALDKGLDLVYHPTLVLTDSYYVFKGVTKWVWKWSNNNWKTSENTPVSHKDLWHSIIFKVRRKSLAFKKVKAHSSVRWNEYADSIAREKANEAKSLKDQLARCKSCKSIISADYKMAHCYTFLKPPISCSYYKGDDNKCL